jgi:hypothetical protein
MLDWTGRLRSNVIISLLGLSLRSTDSRGFQGMSSTRFKSIYFLYLFLYLPRLYDDSEPRPVSKMHSISRPSIPITTRRLRHLHDATNFPVVPYRDATTIILVDGNFNMIQGDLRHMDRSTNITNRDAFNIQLESTVTQQPFPSTASLGTSRYRVLKHPER